MTKQVGLMVITALALAAGLGLAGVWSRGDGRGAAPGAERAGLTAGLAVLAVADKPAEQPQRVDFAREVLPILSNHCYLCHGPDQDSAEAKKAGFRLDVRDEAVGFGYITPGDADASTVIDVLTTDRPSRLMPPLDSGKPRLTADQVETLRRWIDQGAEYSEHWAFVKPSKPELPAVADAGWCRNAIDYFVQANLAENGLRPNAPADKRRLIRRAYLDLIGLPPTPEQVEAYVNDPSPDAYEKVVDGLLASPQFGEHWARQWLDKARYADSQGYEKDRPRTMWRYRDWVIHAYNADMPFDQFTREQLAGDLLEAPTLDQLIATGFHRNTMNNTEGGTDDEEFRSAAVIDRVNTTMEVWMGMTMGCVQCHSHKYDPLYHEEYYRFYAFFNQTADADTDDDAPSIQAPTDTQSAELDRLQRELDGLLSDFDRPDSALARARVQWEEALADASGRWQVLAVRSAEADNGVLFDVLDDGSLRASGENPETTAYTVTASTRLRHITAVRLEAIAEDSLPNGGPGRAGNGNFVVNDFKLAVGRGDTAAWQDAALVNASATFEQDGWPVDNAIDADAGRDSGWAVVPRTGRTHSAVFEVVEDLGGLGDARLRFTIVHAFGGRHTLGRFRIWATDQPRPVREVPRAVRDLLAIAPDQRTGEQRQRLDLYFIQTAPEAGAIRERVAALRGQIDQLQRQVPTALVMRELPEARRRDTYLFGGGSFLAPDKERGIMPPDTPEVFPPFPDDAPRNRLGLAQWLTGDDNPLTARVQVNRIWEQVWGIGLVQTTNDFGFQGSYPSNKALLDYLAVTYQHDLKWSTKSLIRLIVTSSAYRQSAAMSSDRAEIDPYNQLISRGPRGRLSAEQVRDQALAIAGLLKTDRLGGPPVVPYLPDGLLSQGGDNGRVMVQSAGEDLYRRGVYTEWRRTGHYPSFAAFDAPSREICTIKRSRTNTPLQALVTLNDPVYIEAAQALGRRLIAERGGDIDARLRRGMMLAVAREPSATELAALRRVYDESLAEYREDPESASQIATDPAGPLPEGIDPADAAAMTLVGNVLLNLDEVITKP